MKSSKFWGTPDGRELSKETLSRLVAGKPLDDLGLGTYEGRVDLRGFLGSLPARSRRNEVERWFVEELGGLVEFRGVTLENLDFGGALLPGLRFFDSRIANCSFDQANCQDWRLWGVDVTDSRFHRADLRRSALGPWYQGRGNVYRRVDLSHSDLRSIAAPAATFVDCDFSFARLHKVDFQSSGFIRCRFAGELREVIFWDHGFKTGKPDPNLMEDVDFSQATLRGVEFRRLSLDRVKLPEDSEHLIIRNYPCVLESAVNELEDEHSLQARQLRAALLVCLKWVVPAQRVGVLSRADLADWTNDPGAGYAVTFLRRLEERCDRST